jgi:peptidoglycan-associated lipoprotein
MKNWNWLLAAALFAGCAHARPADNKTAGATPASAAASEDEPSLRNELLQHIAGLKTVTFAYNSDLLDADAQATLAANAAWLKDNPGVRVQVSGNCDQRGTVEYNIALGQRRSAAVRKFYLMVGVDGARVATISYGKERPVCNEQEEACWRRNRRAETLGAFPATASSRR